MLNHLFPYLGFGLGLKPKHYQAILNEKPAIDWFEIITENFLLTHTKAIAHLNKIRENYPIAMHGVSLSIGSTDPLNLSYLKQVKALADYIQPQWISDHLCFTGVNKINTHDLLPLPYTRNTITHVVERIQQVQEYLGQPILIENLSSYITYQESEMAEWEFISAIAKQAGCYILLDINNIYVSSFNHKFNPKTYIDYIPQHTVKQFHLAGHCKKGNIIIDTHDAAIIPSVWDLYAYALNRFGPISTLIERDEKIPILSELMLELEKARDIAQNIFAKVEYA